MAPTDTHDARIERRLRLGIRLVFYPFCLGLIVLVWSSFHHRSGSVTRAQQAAVNWTGATAQGQRVHAVTVHGVFTAFQTRVVTHCVNGTTWILRLNMSAGEFTQNVDAVNGRQGPTLRTSDQGESVLIATRVREQIRPQPVGTILSEVTRRPGPYSVHCSSYDVTYTLRRTTGP